MLYFTKTPALLRCLFKSCVWKIPTTEKKVYLTFDDGPHPTATPFVLQQLKAHQAKGSFFCIGKNVVAHPSLYQQILDEGHRVGNHTHHHLNGWKTNTRNYLENILMAAKYIDSKLFRPPYGRISPFQIQQLRRWNDAGFQIIMWDVLSGDFDTGIDGKKCLENVLLQWEPGSIIVFHDSAKSWERLRYALPPLLDYFSKEGIQMEPLP